MLEVLRACVVCGVQATDESELQKFVTDETMKYHKANLCVRCANKRNRVNLLKRLQRARESCWYQKAVLTVSQKDVEAWAKA